MKKVLFLVAFLIIGGNAFASYTFSQTFFDDYDHLTGNNFAYKNNSYRDDAKSQNYEKYGLDESKKYNCAYDASGKLRCGDYILKKSRPNSKTVSKEIIKHYDSLKHSKTMSSGDDFNCSLDDGKKGRFDTPQKVKTDIQFKRLSMSKTYTCGIAKSTNKIYCWGKATKGKKSTTNLDSSVPVEV